MRVDLEEKTPYTKKPLLIRTQVAKLKKRGLIIDDEDVTCEYLSNISYYRLRAYTYPFQNNTDESADHEFKRKDIHFKDIVDLYCFDKRLRSLVFNAVEKIEVAIRAKIIQIYSEATMQSHWFEDNTLFREKSGKEYDAYATLLEDILREVNRNNEDFINHYKNKYSEPKNPPAWITLEVISFGALSRLYQLLRKDKNKLSVANQLGLNSIVVLENWLHALSNLRNCCAHHSRIWNRRFIVKVLLPTNTNHLFIDKNNFHKIHTNKLFSYLCCIKYILDIISPNNDFYKNLKVLIDAGGKLLSLKEMGFPENWRDFGVWKE